MKQLELDSLACSILSNGGTCSSIRSRFYDLLGSVKYLHGPDTGSDPPFISEPDTPAPMATARAFISEPDTPAPMATARVVYAMYTPRPLEPIEAIETGPTAATAPTAARAPTAPAAPAAATVPVASPAQLGTLVATATPVPLSAKPTIVGPTIAGPSAPMAPIAVPMAPSVPMALLRPSEVATGMEARFLYTRGDEAPDCSDANGANGANGLVGLKCLTVDEPVFAQKQYYALVVHLDSVPSSATRLVVVSEGTRGVGDPELAFDPEIGVYAVEGSVRRSKGGVRVGARTRVVYVVDAEDARCFLRAVDETTGASNEVAVTSNWTTGPAGGIITVYAHPSVSRAVFLWSDSRPTATASL